MQVKIFFVEKGIEPKIFGFENMMERGIRQILTFVKLKIASELILKPSNLSCPWMTEQIQIL